MNSFVFLALLSGAVPVDTPLPQIELTPERTTAVYEFGRPIPEPGLPPGLSGFFMRGCGSSDDILLPARYLRFAVPPGSEVSLTVRAEGTFSLPGGTVARVVLGSAGCDSFVAAER
ncbi:hypothetical protein GF402_08775, partial [Candidatus Fermentibacteria bacterium]|nr:hypothetical protein [Candidatus Fermentibacteria bacterium]